jgi:ABC-type lipoprotein release transport system permease subunit
MRMNLVLAWRNLWRNRRRTLISAASILFAMSLAWITRSMQNGSYDRMIESVVGFYPGYIQIHAAGYWDVRSLDRSFIYDRAFQTKAAGVRHVTRVVPRLEGFALAGYGSATAGASVIGISPEDEDALTHLSARVTKGRYLSGGDEAVLVGQGLAGVLKASIGDTIVLYGQGYHGMIAAGKYPIAGLVEYPTPEFNTTMVFMPLGAAQYFYAATDLVDNVAIMLDARKHLAEVEARLGALFPAPEYEVMGWRELMPDVVQSIELDSAGGAMMIVILYIVIGFGILGTVMMMAAERTREFGILIAIGMTKSRLILVTVLESAAIALQGIASGVFVTLPIIIYWYYHPIRLGGAAVEAMLKYGYEPVLPVSLDPSILVHQVLIVLVLAVAASSYAAFYIAALRPTKALRS